ncbi:hypothetical protein DSL72_003935 [Monilinia vaccinii-corymbosi]|uniref:Small ribosomal subunit protein mS41 n=1 Tax=Monilinia vaccinii-corymbosi TaxID=61207 RepID=A0A8A3P3J4_9HELO|nr:hypothetical protein DSL72_003935 [Monilinia vaccinii-corymbosi]
MILKPHQLRPIPSFLLPFADSTTSTQVRSLHHRVKAPPIPRPTPFVPNAQTFLTLIGRNLSQHASKIPTWKELFTLTSDQLREMGVEPPRSRRYLLRWREKFRKGEYGIGGDLQHIENGTAELRVVEVPSSDPRHRTATATSSPGHRKIVVNVPIGASAENKLAEQMVPVQGLRVKGAHTIIGPHVQPCKGGNAARIVIKEGLWEDRRGHKIDGGERRQAEVRAKRRGEEKRAAN